MRITKLWRQDTSNDVQKDPVTQRLLKDKFPTREEFAYQTGSSSETQYRAYLITHGLLYGEKNKSGQPAVAHLFDSGNSWLFRQSESGLTLSDGAVTELFIHDDPEEIAKILAKGSPAHTLTVAHIVTDVLDHLLSRDARLNMRYMLGYHTNQAGLIYSPVKKSLLPVVESTGSDVQLTDVIGKLDELYSGYRIIAPQIASFYDALIERWQRMISSDGKHPRIGIIDQEKHRAYLPQEERAFITDVYRGVIKEAQTKRKDMMKYMDLEEATAREYARVRQVLEGKILDFDEPLLDTQQSRILFSVGQTLYAVAYVGDIVNEVLAQALKAQRDGYPNGDSYQILGVNKSLDGRDSASRMGNTPLSTMASIYTKHKFGLIPQMADLSRKLAGHEIPNEKLVRADTFHLNGLNDSINVLLEHYRKAEKKNNTVYGPYRTLLEFMDGQIEGFNPLNGVKVIHLKNSDDQSGDSSSMSRKSFLRTAIGMASLGVMNRKKRR